MLDTEPAGQHAAADTRRQASAVAIGIPGRIPGRASIAGCGCISGRESVSEPCRALD